MTCTLDSLGRAIRMSGAPELGALLIKLAEESPAIEVKISCIKAVWSEHRLKVSGKTGLMAWWSSVVRLSDREAVSIEELEDLVARFERLASNSSP